MWDSSLDNIYKCICIYSFKKHKNGARSVRTTFYKHWINYYSKKFLGKFTKKKEYLRVIVILIF